MDRLEAVLERVKMAIEENQMPAVSPQKPLTSESKSKAVALPRQALPLKDDPQGQNQLTDLLTQTYALLKKYGERADQTEIRDAGFQWMLAEYPITAITEAFKDYLKTGKEIPTPADILEILDPTTQPLSETVYVRISKKHPSDRDVTEWNYLRAFEEREYKKLAR